MTSNRFRRPREGFSLFEVLLALAVLAIAMALFGQLSSVSFRAVRKTELEAEGAQLCQTRLAEHAAGIRNPVEHGWQIDPRDQPWEFQTQIRNLDSPNLLLITVSVRAIGEPASLISMARAVRHPRHLSRGT